MSNYDDIYYDTYNEGDLPEEKSKAARIAGIIGKTAVITVVAVILSILLFRMWEMKEPSGIGDFLWTPALSDAYAKLDGTQTTVAEKYAGKEYSFEKEHLTAVTVKKEGESSSFDVPVSDYYSSVGFRVFTANTGSYTVTDENGVENVIACSGYYEVAGSPVERAIRVDNVYIVPSAGTVQLTFRYKSDCFEKLNGTKLSSETGFRLSLKDDLSRYYTDYYYKTDSKGVYRYVTMVFENVDLSAVQQLDLVAEYLNEKNEYQSLTLYVYDSALPLPLLSYDAGKPKDNAKDLPNYRKSQDV